MLCAACFCCLLLLCVLLSSEFVAAAMTVVGGFLWTFVSGRRVFPLAVGNTGGYRRSRIQEGVVLSVLSPPPATNGVLLGRRAESLSRKVWGAFQRSTVKRIAEASQLAFYLSTPPQLPRAPNLRSLHQPTFVPLLRGLSLCLSLCLPLSLYFHLPVCLRADVTTDEIEELRDRGVVVICCESAGRLVAPWLVFSCLPCVFCLSIHG